jgi:hypothetical protein
MSRYIVWRKDCSSVFRIWLDNHFTAARIQPPGPDHPDRIYAGDNYAEALAAAAQANAASSTGRLSQIRVAHLPTAPARSKAERKARLAAIAATPATLFG